MNPSIPFLDFKTPYIQLKNELDDAYRSVMESGWYIMGKHLEAFEQQYAAFSGTRFCVGTANGLDALILALKALDIGKGDEVIVPSNTYIATVLAVTAVGAVPVLVEPRPETYNLNPELLEDAITPACKAIMPVHLYGQACEMDFIEAVTQKFGLFIIEDNAQAQGAHFNGRKTGAWGQVNGTSFYPGKNLGAYGDAGAVTVSDENFYLKVKALRNYGSEKKYYNIYKGMNSRLDEMQAALLSVKLKYLDEFNSQRKKVAGRYLELLAGVGDLILPQTAPGADHVWHLFVVRTGYRDAFQDFLTQKGIGTLIHYPVPPHLQEAYSDLGYQKGAFPIAEQIADTCLSLPMYPGLTDEQIEYICRTAAEFFNSGLA